MSVVEASERKYSGPPAARAPRMSRPPVPTPSGSPVSAMAGALVAVALHGGLAYTLAIVPPGAWSRRPPPTVELEVLEPPPPPPPAPVEPPPPEPPPPKPVARRTAPKPPPEPIPETPPPNQEPPPEPPAEPAPPVFGVTMDSVVTGESSVAVPVGNTLMTKDTTPRKPGPAAAPPAVAEGPPSFAPVGENYIGRMPELLHEVKADFPAEAKRMGVEGRVVMRVAIDRKGAIRWVRVVKKAGFGFDEAAVAGMQKFKFSPALTRDGQPVDFVITYTYIFQERR